MYVALINVPGYLPTDDDPPTFDTAREAWEYLADERKRAEDDDFTNCTTIEHTDTGYSATVNVLEQRAQGNFDPGLTGAVSDIDELNGEGSIHADTPGAHSPYDLGLVYTVQVVE